MHSSWKLDDKILRCSNNNTPSFVLNPYFLLENGILTLR
uniref:Uncharacterized protein n=1 Tax=Rhizophora mucronata TaxID=61149 RepID=A0A2P2QCX7_RHIMU